MDIKVRFTILSLVFVLSTVFFWLAINEYLLQSKAQQASNLQVVPHSQEIECNPQGDCYLHILGSTATDNGVAGISGHVEYGSYLTPDRVDQVGLCKDSSYGTDTTLQFNDDAQSNVLTFSVGSLRDDSELKGGNGCLTTVVFKPTNVSQDPTETKLRLVADSAYAWRAGGLIAGQRAELLPQVETDAIKVTIDSSVQWPPDDGTGGPSPVPSTAPIPGSCDLYSKADCDCNDAIDLVDWEALRGSLNNEGPSCDPNEDGSTNALDVSIWRENNDLVNPIIITGE